MYEKQKKSVENFCREEGFGFKPYLTEEFGQHGIVWFVCKLTHRVMRGVYQYYSDPYNETVLIGTSEPSYSLTQARALYCCAPR